MRFQIILDQYKYILYIDMLLYLPSLLPIYD